VLITNHNYRNLIFYDSHHHLYVTYLNVQVSATSYTKSRITTERFAQGWCCWNRWTTVSGSVHSLLIELSLSICFCKASNFYYLFLLVGHVVAARLPCEAGDDTALTELSTRNIFLGRGIYICRCVGLVNFPTSYADSATLTLLEHLGPVQTTNSIAVLYA